MDAVTVEGNSPNRGCRLVIPSLFPLGEHVRNVCSYPCTAYCRRTGHVLRYIPVPTKADSGQSSEDTLRIVRIQQMSCH